MFADELWIGTMLDGEARWVVASTTNTVEEARRRHNTSPVATAALGRLMTGTLFLASSLKGEEAVTTRLLGDGPLGGVVSVGKANGEVRGYVREPNVDLELKAPGKLNVAEGVGNGEFVVSRSLDSGNVYTGMVPIVSGEIAEDFANYLLTSEQITSAVALGVLVETDYHVSGSAGFLIQPLPGASEETIKTIEDRLEALAGISSIAAESSSMNELVDKILGDLNFTVLERRPVKFRCSCSKDKLEETLISLGQKELEELISEGKAELVCHFCNEQYLFNEQELRDLLERAR
ncbi:MAG: Hsp33 family molecular chaperone HslO [Desulfitobacterium hafniense]|nr:Hsp33 family molecular chaperone HslO [Desulfitobacterium hafniense]